MPSRAAEKFVPTSDAIRLSNLSRVFAVDEVRNFCSHRRKAYGNTLRKEWRTEGRAPPTGTPLLFGDASQKAD